MSNIVEILKMVAVLTAAGIVGNWFLSEVKRARAEKAPWYKPYGSAPGLIILMALVLPLLFMFLSR